MLGRLVCEELDLSVNVKKSGKIHPLTGYRTAGSHTESDWILALRDSHVICDLAMNRSRELDLVMSVLDHVRGAGRLIFTRRSEWPFDTEAHPLVIRVASSSVKLLVRSLPKFLKHVKYAQLNYGEATAFSPNLVKAISLEPGSTVPVLTLWLSVKIQPHEISRLLQLEKNLLLRFRLHHQFAKMDAREADLGMLGYLSDRYEPRTRHLYHMYVMNEESESTRIIRSKAEFRALEYPAGPYTLARLQHSRIRFYHQPASLQIMEKQSTVLVLAVTCDCKYLPDLLAGCDWLVSRANAFFLAMLRPPSLVLIEPMIVEPTATKKQSKKQGARQAPKRQHNTSPKQKPVLNSRLHFVLPGINGLDDQAMITLYWSLFHGFARSCGIPDPIELLTLDTKTLGEIQVHKSPAFTERLEKASSEMVTKAVTGPSEAEIRKSYAMHRTAKLSLAQLKERALLRERVLYDALLQEQENLKTQLDMALLQKEARELEIQRTELLKREEDAARKLKEEQEAAQKKELEEARLAELARQRQEQATAKARDSPKKISSQTSRLGYVEPKIYAGRRQGKIRQSSSLKVAEPSAKVSSNEIKQPIANKTVVSAVPVVVNAVQSEVKRKLSQPGADSGQQRTPQNANPKLTRTNTAKTRNEVLPLDAVVNQPIASSVETTFPPKIKSPRPTAPKIESIAVIEDTTFEVVPTLFAVEQTPDRSLPVTYITRIESFYKLSANRRRVSIRKTMKAAACNQLPYQ